MKNLILMLTICCFFACNKTTEKSTSTPSPAKKTAAVEPAPKVKKADTQGKINWLTIEQAQSAAKAHPKNLLVDVYTSWCGPCKMMDRNTFTNPEVIKHINENFYAVKWNAEGAETVTYDGKEYSNARFDPSKTKGRNSTHELTRVFDIQGYPTLVVLNPALEKVDAIVGYRDAPKLMADFSKIKS